MDTADHGGSAGAGPGGILLSLRGIGKRYGRRVLLDGLDADVARGRVLGIGGPNGSGKSTLIRIMAGLERPDRGTVTIVGSRSRGGGADSRPSVGWVAPEVGLYGSLTGTEHVAFYAELRGTRLSLQQAESALEAVGLAVRRRAPVATYSSGMRQRLRYACATAHMPDVLLLDEPLTALDDSGADIVRRIVADQRRRGTCVVAGNMAAELALADETLWLAGGAGVAGSS
jgi:heme exporter protein A